MILIYKLIYQSAKGALFLSVFIKKLYKSIYCNQFRRLMFTFIPNLHEF